MAEQLTFNDLSSLHQICTDFIDDSDVIVGMQNDWIDMCTVRYKITDTNDFDLVLDEMRKGFATLPIKREVNGNFTVEVYSKPQDYHYDIYVFLSETDDDGLLITISTKFNIVP
jgi:hypothetical protein